MIYNDFIHRVGCTSPCRVEGTNEVLKETTLSWIESNP